MMEPTKAWEDCLDEANEALRRGDAQGALQSIRKLPGDIDGSDGPWPKALALFARIAYALSADDTGAAAEAAAAGDEPADWFRLGHELIDCGWTDLAAGVLMHAHRLYPGYEPITAELVAALELEGRYRTAVDILERAAVRHPPAPLLRYLRGFNGMMIGDIDGARAALAGLGGVEEDNMRFLSERLAAMIARFDAVSPLAPPGSGDTQGWHFVWTGGLLLRSADGEDVGHLARTLDTPVKIKEGLTALAAVMNAWRLAPPTVLFPPERGSGIVASALSGLLGCKSMPWYGGAEPGIIVMYDPAYVIAELREAPKQHAPGQNLFIRTMNAGREHAVAPDFLGCLQGGNTPFWGPGFDSDNRYIKPSAYNAEQLADIILDAVLPTEVEAAIAETAALAARLADVPPQAQPAALRQAGERMRVWRTAR